MNPTPYGPEPSAGQNPVLAQQPARELRGAWGRPSGRTNSSAHSGLIARLRRVLTRRR